MKGFSRNSPQKVHPNFTQNLGRHILGNTFSGLKFGTWNDAKILIRPLESEEKQDGVRRSRIEEEEEEQEEQGMSSRMEKENGEGGGWRQREEHEKNNEKRVRGNGNGYHVNSCSQQRQHMARPEIVIEAQTFHWLGEAFSFSAIELEEACLHVMYSSQR